jgi:hypothetical protein
MDQRPELLGFDNGIYELKHHGNLVSATHQHQVLMSCGYDYQPGGSGESRGSEGYVEEISVFFRSLGLEDLLPALAGLLHGNRREPCLWVKNLDVVALQSIRQLLQWSLGDYFGQMSFSVLRKRKIPSIAKNHTHSELIELIKKRVVVVEQRPDDFPEVNLAMVETLLCSKTLNLRNPGDLSGQYVPQFGLLVLSCHPESEPMPGSYVFDSLKPDWKKIRGFGVVESEDDVGVEGVEVGEVGREEGGVSDSSSSSSSDDDGSESSVGRQMGGQLLLVKEAWKFDFIKMLLSYL